MPPFPSRKYLHQANIRLDYFSIKIPAAIHACLELQRCMSSRPFGLLACTAAQARMSDKTSALGHTDIAAGLKAEMQHLKEVCRHVLQTQG